jgi:hypothetical protein
MSNIVEVSATFKSEILERIRIYTEEPEAVINPEHPESQEDYDELLAYLVASQEHPEDTTLDAKLCDSFVADLESSLRSYKATRESIYRSLLKFYVDAGFAVPVDTQAFKEGRAGCSGGISGATWFTYNKVRYQAK